MPGWGGEEAREFADHVCRDACTHVSVLIHACAHSRAVGVNAQAVLCTIPENAIYIDPGMTSTY